MNNVLEESLEEEVLDTNKRLPRAIYKDLVKMGGVYVCQCTNSSHLRRASSLDKGSELEFKVVKPHKYFSRRLKSICSKNKCKGEILCQDHSLNERIQHVSKYLLGYYQKTLNVKIA